MRVIITGGAGFLGQRLARAILARGGLAGPGGQSEPLSRLVLLDRVAPAAPPEGAEVVTGDIGDKDFLADVFAPGCDSVFHLAAVVSAAAEADFELGMRVNLDGTRAVVDACRRLPNPPRLVFASSIAVFGIAPGASGAVDDDTTPAPRSSYGVQKAMCELLIEDCTRRGFIDGRALRLPTVVVRPGRPNKAASSFASSILREPLAGERTVCPVSPDLQVFIASPRCATAALLHGHDLAAEALGARRTLNLPGLTVSVGEMAAALGRAGGDAGLIDWRRDEAIERIVAGWPAVMRAERAEALGFERDLSIDAILRAHLEEGAAGV